MCLGVGLGDALSRGVQLGRAPETPRVSSRVGKVHPNYPGRLEAHPWLSLTHYQGHQGARNPRFPAEWGDEPAPTHPD